MSAIGGLCFQGPIFPGLNVSKTIFLTPVFQVHYVPKALYHQFICSCSSIFPWLYIPEAIGSQGSMFPRVYGSLPRALRSELLYIPNACLPRDQCFQGPKSPIPVSLRLYILNFSNGHYFHGSMFPSAYVPSALGSQGYIVPRLVFPSLYILNSSVARALHSQGLCSVGAMFPQHS